MANLITKIIPVSLKLKLAKLNDILNIYIPNRKKIQNTNKDIIYLMDTPTHSNLGDHAIAYAERVFCQKNFPDREIIEVPIPVFYEHIKFMKRHIKQGDVICMVGGGNFGDLYLESETKKRIVCEIFKNNKIIIFPQTIWYSDTEQGNNEKKKTIKVLNAHKKLTVAARDRESYKRATNLFDRTNVILVPDMVMYLHGDNSSDNIRKGILCCFRDDIEKNTYTDVEKIIEYFKKNKVDYTITDTISSKGVSLGERFQSLQNKWIEFSNSKLVITDRLHGMIFSYITNTPCIALDNSTHKIRDYYETWMKDVPYIVFLEQIEEILDLDIEKIKKSNVNMKEYFNILIKEIKNDSVK